jgi:putative membrane protein
MTILLRILVSAAALGVAAWVVPGIVVAGHSDASKAGTLLVVAIIFGIINMLLKPIIKTVGCAFYVLTLGLVAVVVNGLLLWLASWVAGSSGCRSTSPASWPPWRARSSSPWSAGCCTW